MKLFTKITFITLLLISCGNDKFSPIDLVGKWKFNFKHDIEKISHKINAVGEYKQDGTVITNGDGNFKDGNKEATRGTGDGPR